MYGLGIIVIEFGLMQLIEGIDDTRIKEREVNPFESKIGPYDEQWN